MLYTNLELGCLVCSCKACVLIIFEGPTWWQSFVTWQEFHMWKQNWFNEADGAKFVSVYKLRCLSLSDTHTCTHTHTHTYTLSEFHSEKWTGGGGVKMVLCSNVEVGGGGGGGGDGTKGMRVTAHHLGDLGSCSPKKCFNFRRSENASDVFSEHSLFSNDMIKMTSFLMLISQLTPTLFTLSYADNWKMLTLKK